MNEGTRGKLAERLTLQRTLGAPWLFSVGYASVSASVYVALGALAGLALGLTPLVMAIVGIAFSVTLMVYMEGATLYPERGGSATFARYAFNEMVSFVAGWAMLLDYLIVIAVAAFAVPHYLDALVGGLAHGPETIAISVAVIVVVAMANIMGLRAGARKRAARLAVIDLVLQLAIIVLGLALLAEPELITRHIELGSAPSWRDLVYALVIATIAFAGIEAASNIAPELKSSPRELKRVFTAGSVTVVAIYTGIAVVALMAVPVGPANGGGFETELGGRYVEAPMLGVIANLTTGWIASALKYLVAVVGTLVLVQAANSAMIGVSGLSFSLATNRQLPNALAKLHQTRSTPYVSVALASLVAIVLTFPEDLDLLLSIYAFGAFIAITLSNLSIVVLRIKEPQKRRLFKMPINVRIRGYELPLLALIGAPTAFLTWVSVVIFHSQARWLGLGWMALGLMLYTIYRVSTGKSLTKRVTVEPESLKEAEKITYGNILVPIFGSDIDDDIMGTAGRFAAEEGREGRGSVIEALYPLVVPISLPLDVRLPQGQIEAAENALARAKEVGEEYEGVKVATALVRTRYAGSAVVEEAKRRAVEVIVVGGKEPSPVSGGPILGGVSGRGTQYVGAATEYILRKAPCQVILTAPPEKARPGGTPPAASPS